MSSTTRRCSSYKVIHVNVKINCTISIQQGSIAQLVWEWEDDVNGGPNNRVTKWVWFSLCSCSIFKNKLLIGTLNGKWHLATKNVSYQVSTPFHVQNTARPLNKLLRTALLSNRCLKIFPKRCASFISSCLRWKLIACIVVIDDKAFDTFSSNIQGNMHSQK